jgi:hypothetical protein
MPINLPFACPDLVLPISGAKPVGTISTSALSEWEKKFMAGLKLSISRSVQTDFEKWIVYLAYCDCFSLHMWKPTSGELRHIHLVPDLKISKDCDENTITVHAINEDDTSYQHIIQCNYGSETTGLYDFLICARNYDSAATVGDSVRVSLNQSETSEHSARPVEQVKTSLSKGAISSSRLSEGSEMTPEELEKYQKRQALGSLSRRMPSWMGATGTSRKSNGDFPSPEKQSSMSRLSNVFGNVQDDDEDES